MEVHRKHSTPHRRAQPRRGQPARLTAPSTSEILTETVDDVTMQLRALQTALNASPYLASAAFERTKADHLFHRLHIQLCKTIEVTSELVAENGRLKQDNVALRALRPSSHGGTMVRGVAGDGDGGGGCAPSVSVSLPWHLVALIFGFFELPDLARTSFLGKAWLDDFGSTPSQWLVVLRNSYRDLGVPHLPIRRAPMESWPPLCTAVGRLLKAEHDVKLTIFVLSEPGSRREASILVRQLQRGKRWQRIANSDTVDTASLPRGTFRLGIDLIHRPIVLGDQIVQLQVRGGWCTARGGVS
jgi:hypothetical protein